MEEILKNKILKKIKEGKVKMKPKIYFIFRAVFFVAVFVLFLGFSFFLFSFIHFYLISSGLWYLPSFGAEGTFLFLRSFPWLLIILALILILILEILARKFTFSFKKPVLVSILLIVFIILIGSAALAKTNIHSKLLMETKKGKIPAPISPLYLKYGMPKFQEFHRGIIEKVSTSSVFIKRRDGEVLEAKFEKKTPFFEKLREGEGIVIFGKKENGKIRSRKIKKIQDRFLDFERKTNNSSFKLK